MDLKQNAEMGNYKAASYVPASTLRHLYTGINLIGNLLLVFPTYAWPFFIPLATACFVV